MNHLDLVNEVVASTASLQEFRFLGCSPLTSVKNTDLKNTDLLSSFICSRSLLLALLIGAKIVDLWNGSEY